MTSLPSLFLLMVFCCLSIDIGESDTISGKECRADIGFLLDGSGSVKKSNWNKTLNFVIEFAKKVSSDLTFGEDHNRIGVVSFGNVGSMDISLDQHFDIESFSSHVKAIRYMDENTNTADGLRKLHALFQSTNGARKDVPRIGIIVTDGVATRETEHTQDEAKKLREDNISLLGLGIGDKLNLTELRAIVHDRERVYSVRNFDQLLSKVNQILKETCKSLPYVKPTARPVQPTVVTPEKEEEEHVIGVCYNNIPAGLQPQMQRLPSPAKIDLPYLEKRFTKLMTSVPTPVLQRPGVVGKPPRGGEAFRIIRKANEANLIFSNSFNSENATGAASRYQLGALMEARPMGVSFGRQLIESFWQGVVSKRPGPIRYSNVRMRAVDDETVTFASDWTFSTMRGIIMLESWKKMSDGSFQLDEDRFEIQEVYETAKIVTNEQKRQGLEPLNAINEVMNVMEEFTDLYNDGSLEAIDRIMEFYSESAEYSLDPVGVFIGKPAIKASYVQFLEDRKKYGLAKSNISFTNIKVQVLSPTVVHLSGDYDEEKMGSGYINLMRFVKQNGRWLLEIDDSTFAPTPFLY